jgi:hypothetical protein
VCRNSSPYSWKSDIEGGSLVYLRLDPNPAAIAINNALADSEADPRAWDLFAMQSLENAEDLGLIQRLAELRRSR